MVNTMMLVLLSCSDPGLAAWSVFVVTIVALPSAVFLAVSRRDLLKYPRLDWVLLSAGALVFCMYAFALTRYSVWAFTDHVELGTFRGLIQIAGSSPSETPMNIWSAGTWPPRPLDMRDVPGMFAYWQSESWSESGVRFPIATISLVFIALPVADLLLSYRGRDSSPSISGSPAPSHN